MGISSEEFLTMLDLVKNMRRRSQGVGKANPELGVKLP
jgi:hypothetical protein